MMDQVDKFDTLEPCVLDAEFCDVGVLHGINNSMFKCLVQGDGVLVCLALFDMFLVGMMSV